MTQVLQTSIQEGLPPEIKELNTWTNHINKRPLIAPNQAYNGKTYEQVTDASNELRAQYGILVSDLNPYLFIDIDFPDSSPELKAQKQHISNCVFQQKTVPLNSDEHREMLQPLYDSIKDTVIEELLTQTYCEYSPSGTGLRLIVKCDQMVKSHYNKAYYKAVRFKGQIDFKNQFITITEHQCRESPSTITHIDSVYDTFGTTFNIPMANKHKMKETDEQSIPAESPEGALPTLQAFHDMILALPIDQSARIKATWETVTGKQYEHYDYWLSIGMAIHDYALRYAVSNFEGQTEGKTKGQHKMSQFYLLYLTWSSMDEISFTSDEDVLAKWQSFGQADNDSSITWLTVQRLHNEISFVYPRPVISKGRVTKNPQNNEYINFEYLMNYYDLKLYEQGGLYYIKGDLEICNKYFCTHSAALTVGDLYGPISFDGLCAATVQLCQDSLWRGLTATSNHVKTWVQYSDRSLDIFKLWLDTPFNELPDNMRYRQLSGKDGDKELLSIYDDQSTFDYLFECLNVDANPETQPAKYELYYSMVKKTLMQMIKFRENITTEFDGNGGVLILVGAENTYKSTFLKMLTPKGLEHLHKEVNMQVKGEKAVRDFVRYLGNKLVVQIDEFEDMMDQGANSGLFKALISGNSTSMTDIFQSAETEIPRKAIIVASTNERKQQMSNNGSRRLWFIEVNKIDTKAMLHINLHTLYNALRDEFRQEVRKGKLPWLLQQDEIQQLYAFNENLEAKTDLALWLEDLWPTSEPMLPNYMDDIKNVQTYVGPKLCVTRDIGNMLKIHGYSQSLSRAALERALEKHLGRWTNSDKEMIRMTGISSDLYKGRLMHQQNAKGQYKYKKWLMPPMTRELSLS